MPAHLAKLPDVRKIAILRANALGDFIFILPAVHALRAAYSQAEIVLLGKMWHAGFVLGHVPDIDRVVVVPAYPGVSEPEAASANQAQLDAFFAGMQAEKFDLAFQMQGGGRNSNPFIRRLEARYSVGSRTPDAEKLDVSVPYRFYQNEVLRHLELVSYAGAATTELVPRIFVTAAGVAEAQRLTSSTDNYVVMHPGATDPRRRWPAEKFAGVARYFLNKGQTVYVTGIADEREAVERVVSLTEGRAINACDVLSLGGLTGLLSGARLMVSNDTGPLHLARAVGCPTVGIYWCGNFITAGPMQHARHVSLLSWTVNCPVCGKRCVSNIPFGAVACDHQVSFVADVRVDDVVAMATNLVNNARKAKI
jgi:ADP-heptose:LPS heptosyltransferase